MLPALPDTDQTFRRGRAAMLLPGEGEGMNDDIVARLFITAVFLVGMVVGYFAGVSL